MKLLQWLIRDTKLDPDREEPDPPSQSESGAEDQTLVKTKWGKIPESKIETYEWLLAELPEEDQPNKPKAVTECIVPVTVQRVEVTYHSGRTDIIACNRVEYYDDRMQLYVDDIDRVHLSPPSGKFSERLLGSIRYDWMAEPPNVSKVKTLFYTITVESDDSGIWWNPYDAEWSGRGLWKSVHPPRLLNRE